MSKHLIAVYGSLRQGFGNHRIIQEYPCVAVGYVDGYAMFDYCGGGFPAIVPGGDAVRVEVYEVDDEGLASVDMLEGHPRFYERIIDTIAPDKFLSPGPTPDEFDVFLYVQAPHQVEGKPCIPSGDWAQYKGVA